MIVDSKKPSAVQLGVRAVPHPAMRRTAGWLAAVLAADLRGIICTPEPEIDPAARLTTRAIYIRPAATDAFRLIAAAELAVAPSLRNTCAAMASFDAASRDLYCVAWEELLANPHGTLRAIAVFLGLTLSQEVALAVDENIAALRRDLVIYDHPLSFIAGLDGAPLDAGWTDDGCEVVDGSGDISHLIGSAAPRRALVVTSSEDPLIDIPVHDASDWQIEAFHVSLGEPPQSESASSPVGLIYLQRVETAPALDHLLDQLVPRLAGGSVLCGEELSEAAAARTVAKLTARGDQHDLIFSFAGSRWIALSPAERR